MRKFTIEHRRKLSESHKGKIPANKGTNTQVCKTCSISFHIKKCHVGKKFYCSMKCYSKAMKNKIPWNKGLTNCYSEDTRRRISEKQKGIRNSISTEFKKGENIGSSNNNWKNGETIKEGGYVMIRNNTHPSRRKFGYIKRSRLVVEKHLNIFLPNEFVVHHINEIKNDDRIENLMVFISHSAHMRHHFGSKVYRNEIFFDGSKLNVNNS